MPRGRNDVRVAPAQVLLPCLLSATPNPRKQSSPIHRFIAFSSSSQTLTLSGSLLCLLKSWRTQTVVDLNCDNWATQCAAQTTGSHACRAHKKAFVLWTWILLLRSPSCSFLGLDVGLRDALKFQKTGLSQEYNLLARKALSQQNLGLPVTHFKKGTLVF